MAKRSPELSQIESNISHIDGKNGRLFYRGYSIEDILKKKTFEEVVYLLWEGKFPSKMQLALFKRRVSKHNKLPDQVKKLIKTFPKSIETMAAMRTCISFIANTASEEIKEIVNKEKSINILAVSPTILAAIERHRQGKQIINPKNKLSIAENFLYMLHNKVPNKQEAELFDKCLSLHAEHGLNVSTFSARVTVATLSDIYSGVISAIGTLKGPLHGGANKKAVEMLIALKKKYQIKKVCTIKDLKNIEYWVLSALKRKQKIMGIGHRVYKTKDPRIKILETYIEQTNKDPSLYQIAKEIEKVVAKEKGLYPNVDFLSGIVYKSLGIPKEAFVGAFAIGRNAGWIAHILEQYKDNRLIRPKARYTGKLRRL